MNSFGSKLRLTTFGESHGKAMGGVIDGFPPGFKINFDELLEEIAKRKPGSSSLVTQRNESDLPEFLSGISEEGITLGTPIGFIIRNIDNRGRDYSDLADKYRPNHADFTYEAKYGIREHRGGGRASARETVNWVVAGALASQWLKSKGINIRAKLTGAGSVSFTKEIMERLAFQPFENNILDISKGLEERLDQEILKAKNDGDSVGGSIICVITGIPAGIGNPVFDKLQSKLAGVMMSINAAKSFEYGLGFDSSLKRGSQIIDNFDVKGGKVITRTNYSGGIQGGITNGMPVFFSVAFKPTPTIMKELQTINNRLEPTSLKMKGRHDPCVAVRAVPVIKSLAALVVADAIL